MNTLYYITRILTFFGTECRCAFEHIACRILKLPIEDTRTFKDSELCGHIEHELAPTLGKAFFVCWFPFTLNCLLACCFLYSGAYRIVYAGDYSSLASWLFLWLGFSFAANVFPTFEDALALKDALYGGKNLAAKILLAPFFGVVYAGSFIERYSLTVLTSLAFTIAFPYIFSVTFPFFENIQQMLLQ